MNALAISRHLCAEQESAGFHVLSTSFTRVFINIYLMIDNKSVSEWIVFE